MTEQQDAAPVVVGVDGSESSTRALEWAAGEALRRSVALRVVHAFPADPPISLGHDPGVRAAAQHLLDDGLERARDLIGETVSVQAATIDGAPAKALIGESYRAALLVVGSRGHGGFANLLLGSTSVHVAAHAACPVVVLPRHETPADSTHGPVLVGVDASPASTPALGFAFQRAQERDAGLVALHVWHLPTDYGAYPIKPLTTDSGKAEREARDRLADAIAPWQQRYPQVNVERRVVQGHAVWALAEASAQDPEIVVLGSHGHATLAGMVLGSVSQGVLRHARRPVVVAR